MASNRAYGLEDVLGQAKGLFRRRVEPKLKDHHNFNLARGIHAGIRQAEVPGYMGIPASIHGQLALYDILALYFGISHAKGTTQLNSIPFHRQIPLLIGKAYRFQENRNHAKNAIISMKDMGLGKKELAGTIEHRMKDVPETDKIQYLKCVHSRVLSPPESGPEGYTDRVYEKYHTKNGKPKDSNIARNMYIDEIARLLGRKSPIDANPLFEGHIVKSFTDHEKEYFIQAHTGGLSGHKSYSCTCPSYIYKNDKKSGCKHINSVIAKKSSQISLFPI